MDEAKYMLRLTKSTADMIRRGVPDEHPMAKTVKKWQRRLQGNTLTVTPSEMRSALMLIFQYSE